MSQNRWGRFVVAVAFGFATASPVLAQRSASAPQLRTIGWSGSHGYLGINFRDISEDQVSTLQLKETRGAEVTQVDHDGPACKVGVREHDVILQLNGQTIEFAEQLRRMLHEIPPGRTVTLVFSHEGQQQTVTTQLANREALERQAWDQHIPVPLPDQPSGQTPSAFDHVDRSPASPAAGMGFFGGHAPSAAATVAPHATDRNLIGAVLPPAYTGAALETLGPQLAEYFGAADGNGLLIRSIETNSPAAIAGLKAGDVVVRINQIAVTSGIDWLRVMHESKGRPVQVTILREKKEQVVTLTPDAKHRSSVVLPRPLTPAMSSADQQLAVANNLTHL